MKVILTHNAADFDAVASLLAMHKLEPEAFPVLPAQVNNNVSQFLLLYARELRLIEREDVPRDRVESVFAVDTQRFDMVRGMDAKTPVYIVDHHEPADNLPDHYHYSGDSTGANTTLLVERIAEQGLTITGVEATLMLLGIYEDTGSLSYKVTTPRDMQAAAWLLRHGGDLDIVRQFLEHRMNDAQMKLFQRLQESIVHLVINGHSIILSSTIIPEQVRESAVVAHELLDLFGGDALFMAVQIKDDVQIIARTTADTINLGEVMQHFGGNGHNYAAAAFVRNVSLTSILNRIIDLLPQYVLPVARIKDLMSWGVECIESDTDIASAQVTMLETGHEGYPVLQAGRIVGLLTRRAVDRAILHNLHKLPISEIMEAGTHSITPNDSVEILKERMLATGWGQMPVVNEQDEIIGIVTRTDLIKQWNQHPRPHHRTMWEHLQNLLSPGVRALLEAASGIAESQNRGLYLVGGIVRDLLMEHPNLDIDLVVEGDAITLVAALVEKFGGEMHHHRQFGTAKWILNASV
ncbi:MAG TPA: CBS domain-containing protein, partial [Aggregatilineales bacterium]|nr:CBS domain-containing protein [Aggregatilineales bacterium]